MKKRIWYRSLSLADDKYIAEAHPNNIIKPKRAKLYISVAAACACFALIFCNLLLFIPFNTTPPDVSQYADSEYYGLIQKLNTLTFEEPRYKHNAAMLWAKLKSFSFVTAPGDDTPADIGEADGTGGYKEITDNQVEGIIEADRIKRSDTHIYYLDNEVLRIFSIEGEDTREAGSYTLYGGSKNYYLDQWEFYLSQDAKTVTVITQYYEKTNNSSYRYVNLISLDVSDPENILEKEEFNITGQYMSSRMTNGSILLLTEFVINEKTLDFSDETTFVPQIDDGDGSYSIPASGIVSPDKLSNTRYTVVMKLDENTLELSGTAAYLSYSENAYVSENHIFLTNVFLDKEKNENGAVTQNTMTEISCLTYSGDTLEGKGSVTLRGYVKDQWSMDEYEGILRVFTTTSTSISHKELSDGTNASADILQSTTATNASLYCIELSKLEIVASVIDFAPWGEVIQSVRFDKDTAYACTSVELSDPVFFFDLSYLDSISYKDTGTIEGFSTSLINLGNGYLLGIGRGEGWNSFKAEVYEETADGVRSVCSYELKNAEYSTEYKSYYIDRENQLIGIGIIDKTHRTNKYILLHFDEYELVELVSVPLDGDITNMRGVYIDNYMYIFGQNCFRVETVFDR